MTSIRHGYVVLGCTCAHNDAGRMRDRDCPKHGNDTLSWVRHRKKIEKHPDPPVNRRAEAVEATRKKHA